MTRLLRLRPLLPLLTALGCTGLALLLRPTDSQSLLTTGRHLVRPLVLPILWQGLEASRLHGTTEEYVTTGRVLMQLVPEWSTGHIFLASHLATEASRAQDDPVLALDRLWAGIRMLEAAAIAYPPNSEDLFLAIVRLLTIECNRRPALATAFTERFGNPAAVAERYMRKIDRYETSPFLQDEVCFLVIDGIHHDIRAGRPGWRNRAQNGLATAIDLLGKLRNHRLAGLWSRSLANVDSYLRGSDDLSLSDLAADPRLAKIVAALRTLGG